MVGSAPSMQIELDYVHVVRSKGRIYTYYRRNGLSQRIKGEGGEWLANYNRVHKSFEGRQDDVVPGTLHDLIVRYQSSPDYKSLSPKTRKDYGRYLSYLGEKYGKEFVDEVPRAFVLKLRDKLSDKPRTANYVISVFRLLMQYAIDLGMRETNPASRPRRLKTGEGHRPWEEYEIKAFQKKWGIGTRERVAFELALNTGQRGGDVIKMTRQQRKGGEISVAQEKTKERLWIPESAALTRVLDPWLKGHDHVVMLTTAAGGAFKVDYFRHTMRKAYRKAELPDDCTTHGLRYTAAIRLEELKCDEPTIQAITGHRTLAMLRQYTQKKRGAKLAIARLDEAQKENRDR